MSDALHDITANSLPLFGIAAKQTY